ncbi:MAG: hypothetical protein LQ344_000776 [Seirophora lacunosa]|nr:MAG: hypothetical protein LQ344_000776 [Seirophora lacunosa]
MGRRKFIIRDENKKDPILTVYDRDYEITRFNNLYTKEVKVQVHGEMYLCNLGFPVLSIRSMHKQADWDEAQRKLNDLDEPSDRSVTYAKAPGFGAKKRKVGEEDDQIDEEEADAPEEVLPDTQVVLPGMLWRCVSRRGGGECGVRWDALTVMFRILDEAHRIRSRNTFTHRSIRALLAPYIRMLSATIAYNKAVDLSGPLNQARPVTDQERAGIPELPADGNFHASSHYVAHNIRGLLYVRLLFAPLDHSGQGGYRRISVDAILHSGTYSKEDLHQHWPAEFDYKILIKKGDYDLYGKEVYQQIHEACDKRLGAGDDPETGETRRNMAPHRRLSLACVSPAIEDFTAGMRHQSVQDINTWVTRYDDYGATAYIAATRAGLQYAIYQVSSPPSRMASGGCWQHLVSAS